RSSRFGQTREPSRSWVEHEHGADAELTRTRLAATSANSSEVTDIRWRTGRSHNEGVTGDGARQVRQFAPTADTDELRPRLALSGSCDEACVVCARCATESR